MSESIDSHKRQTLMLGVAQAVMHWARYHPNSIAIEIDGDCTTYRKLAIIASRIADIIPTIESGNTIYILVRDKTLFLASIVAVLSKGGSAGILNPETDTHWLCRTIKHSQAPLAIVDDDDLGEKLKGDISVSDVGNLDLSKASSLTTCIKRAPNDRWGIIYTSGTTGNPKGVERSDHSVLMELVGWIIELGLTRSSRFYIGRPLFYTGGLVLAFSTILVGGCIISPREHTSAILSNISRQNRLTHCFLLPNQAALLAESGLSVMLDLILTMGAPISPDQKKRIITQLDCQYIESWGNSEGLGTITDPADIETRPESIGRPFVGDHMLVVDDTGCELSPGKIGYLAGIADSAMTEYHCNRKKTEKVFIGEVLISEDIASMDTYGYFYLKGRVSRRILRGSMPVFLDEIENELKRCKDVVDACVVAIADHVEGEIPVALVVFSDCISIRLDLFLECFNKCRAAEAQLAKVLSAREIPRNINGKPDYIAVKKMFE